MAKHRRGGHRGKTKPFASKAQARLFFANPRLRRYAKKKAHATAPATGRR